VTLQLADRSIKISRGVVEDVLVQVDKFCFPVDFIVLDTHPVTSPETQIPVILGRPFLATSNALINCRNGVLKLSFGNMTLELNIFNVCKQPGEEEEIEEVNLIDTTVEDHFQISSVSDPLEACIMNSLKESEVVEDELLDTIALLDECQTLEANGWKPKFE